MLPKEAGHREVKVPRGSVFVKFGVPTGKPTEQEEHRVKEGGQRAT